MKSFFVSSTFRDMQEERDIIHRIVFPSLRQKLKKYGETAEEVDLRWGVDTLNLSEEESGQMVIRVCIDAIDRCVPYIIVLLGERYGWIPETTVFEHLQDSRLEKFPKDISITEMEIQYGALMREIGMEHCIFCFRGESLNTQIPEELRKDFVAETEQHKEKLDRLKATIRSIDGACIIDYEAKWDEQEQKVCGLEPFAEQLEQKLIELLEKEGLSEEEVSEEESITRSAEFTMQHYLNTYVNRMKIEEMLPILYASGKNIWCFGESGCGKTAFLSFAANQYRQKGMICRIYYGGDERCRSVDTFLRWLAYELEQICGKKLKEDNHTRRLAVKKIQNLTKHLTEKVMIFVDAIDQMSEETLWILTQLLNTTSKLHFFVTSTQNIWNLEMEEAKEFFAARKLDKLTDAELELIVSKVARRRGKSLDARVTKKIREKTSMYLPVNLSLLLQRLFMMDREEFAKAEELASGMEGISRYMQELIDSAGETSEELVSQVVDKAISTMKAEGGDHITKLLGFIAAAPEGISLRMLSELNPEATALHIQQLLCFLYDMVEETKEGRWVFKHPLYLASIRQMIGDETICSYEEAIFEKYRETRDFRWSEFLSLGKKLMKEDVADELVTAVAEEKITEEQLWQNPYYVMLVKTTRNERYLRCILRGIFQGEVTWSDDIISFLLELDEENLEEKETLFYLYGAKCRIYEHELVSDDEKIMEYSEKQYEIYEKMEEPSKEIFLEVAELCMDGCCGSDSDRRILWFERLSEIIRIFSKQHSDSAEYLLLNILQTGYWRFVNYKDSKSEEDLEQMEKLFEAQHMICKVQDNLNLYEQENPGYNEYAMKQFAVFAYKLAGIFLKEKNFPKAFPYAQIAYEERKKAYQLNRTFKTANLFVWSATNLMRCMKQGSDHRKKYYEEAQQALAWMETQYFCSQIGELQSYLCTQNAEGDQELEMRKKALEISRRLYKVFPDKNYDEWMFFDCRKYADALKKGCEHTKFDEISTLLKEIEVLGHQLFERTGDEYFLDMLHDCCINMMETYIWQELFDDAEEYLQKAEEFKKCDYIQKGRFRWHREGRTAVAGILLYYRKNEIDKLEMYMKRAELLFADEEECNKNTSRRNMAILWSGRMMYMKARILWESSHNLEKTRVLIDDYFAKYTGVVDEHELRPARLLLGELEAAAGNAGKAIIEWKKARMRGEKNMGWMQEHELSEYEVWQYSIAARASFLIYDVTKIKDSVYLNKGMRACTDILTCYTRNLNAAYRTVVGNLLSEYFMKYGDAADLSVRESAARILLIWLQHIREERKLTAEEKELVGECLVCCKNDFDPKEYGEEQQKACEWLLLQNQNDRANPFLLNKALWHCVNGAYAEALKVCESMFESSNETLQSEKELLVTICKIRTGRTIENVELLNAYVGREKIKIWFYVEALIALGEYDSKNEEEYFRKAARFLEKRILDRKKETLKLWEKDYFLRKKCSEYSKNNSDLSIYMEDLKAARMAWANFSDNSKESTMQLIEWDARIAHAYEGVDEKFEWMYWESVGNIMNSFLVKKEILNIHELEQIAAFYHKLLGKLYEANSHRFYTVNMLRELAYDTMLGLYDLTGDVKWLEQTLDAIETYRAYVNSPKLTDDRKDFRNEKIAESFLYDMDVYWLYLKHNSNKSVVNGIVDTAKRWIDCIPGYYKELSLHAIRALKDFDEFLEGSSLEIKALILTLQMRQEGDSNEIFWFIKGMYDKQGTMLSLEEMQELYKKELQTKS